MKSLVSCMCSSEGQIDSVDLNHFYYFFYHVNLTSFLNLASCSFAVGFICPLRCITIVPCINISDDHILISLVKSAVYYFAFGLGLNCRLLC